MKYIGLDVGRKATHFYVCDTNGKKLASGRVDSTCESLVALVELHKDGDGLKVAIETGLNCMRLARAMKGAGAEVTVIDARQNALIRESTKKTDKQDAKQLCEQLRLGILPPKPVYIPTEREEELRALVSLRAALIKMRTQLSNRAIRIADSQGFYLKKSALSRSNGWAELRKESMRWEEAEQFVLEQLYEQFELLQAQINRVEERTQERREKAHPKESALLKSIPGVGEVTLTAFLARVGDAKRFSNAREVYRYTGLSPSLRQSGKSKGEGGITRTGNALLRGYLVQAAIGVIKRKNLDDPLYLWYERIKMRRGWKKARTALARKLAGTMYGVLKSGLPYDPSRITKLKEKAVKAVEVVA